MSELVKNMMGFDTFIREKFGDPVIWCHTRPVQQNYANMWKAWQAQQAKIDELQARIDGALKSIMICEEYNHAEKLDEIYNILKAVGK